MNKYEKKERRDELAQQFREARTRRIVGRHKVTGNFYVGGSKAGDSPALPFISSAILAAIVGFLLFLAQTSTLVICVGAGASLLVGLYMANEQRWLNEETQRMHDANWIDQQAELESSIKGRTSRQLISMIEGQELLARKRESQGRNEDAEVARKYANELQAELDSR